jgi:hypothetical protein
LIAIRVDPSVLESFRKEASRRHIGYQMLINEVLAEHVGKDVALARWSRSGGVEIPLRPIIDASLEQG